jgi:hypothetical protein
MAKHYKIREIPLPLSGLSVIEALFNGFIATAKNVLRKPLKSMTINTHLGGVLLVRVRV